MLQKQNEGGLAVDALQLIHNVMNRFILDDSMIIRNTLKGTRFYNNGTVEGIDCESDPLMPWSYGRIVLEGLHKVRIGLNVHYECNKKTYN